MSKRSAPDSPPSLYPSSLRRRTHEQEPARPGSSPTDDLTLSELLHTLRSDFSQPLHLPPRRPMNQRRLREIIVEALDIVGEDAVLTDDPSSASSSDGAESHDWFANPTSRELEPLPILT